MSPHGGYGSTEDTCNFSVVCEPSRLQPSLRAILDYYRYYYRRLVPAPVLRRVPVLQSDFGVVQVTFRCSCQTSPSRLRPGGPVSINVRRMSVHGPESDSFLWPSTPYHPIWPFPPSAPCSSAGAVTEGRLLLATVPRVLSGSRCSGPPRCHVGYTFGLR